MLRPGPSRAYVGDSLILRVVASMSVTDYLDCSEGRPKRIAGRTDLIRVIEGTGTARIEFAPPRLGRFPTQLEHRNGGLEVTNAADLVVLRSPGIEWTIENGVPDRDREVASALVPSRSNSAAAPRHCVRIARPRPTAVRPPTRSGPTGPPVSNCPRPSSTSITT